jgi:AbrB family looped-hinge helix DNA binding protein
MPTVKVSSKYQVVIPRDVRKITEIKPGTMVDVQVRDGEIVLVPVRPMKEMRGFLRGIDTTIDREPDRRL